MLKRTFASLGVHNFRLFFFGQGISMCGTWMQTIGLAWLVLKLTHSGTQLGFVIAAQFLPILLVGIWGGVVADRFNKRHILYVTQTLAGILALGLGILVVTHLVHVWMVYSFAVALGFVTVVDNPSRQTFVSEMVQPELLRNAITLNSVMGNTARMIGPSIAAILIATAGIGACFIINALTYIAVLIALKRMKQSELRPSKAVYHVPGQIRQGLRYVISVPKLRSTLLMMFIVGTFAYEFPVIMPLFATITFHGNATTYSLIMSTIGVGAVVGGIYAAGRKSTSQLEIVSILLLFGLSIILASIMPNLTSALIVIFFIGVLSILFVSLGNTTLQLNSDPQMRGRVMSLWAIGFQGTTPIGGPIIGLIADHSNPRVGLMVGGISALVASGIGLLALKSRRSKRFSELEYE